MVYFTKKVIYFVEFDTQNQVLDEMDEDYYYEYILNSHQHHH